MNVEAKPATPAHPTPALCRLVERLYAADVAMWHAHCSGAPDATPIKPMRNTHIKRVSLMGRPDSLEFYNGFPINNKDKTSPKVIEMEYEDESFRRRHNSIDENGV